MRTRLTLLVVALAAIAAAPPPRQQSPRKVEEALTGLEARCIGPATMGGRITAIAVNEAKPAVQYVGAASGGVWKTEDDGKSWRCVFDGRPHASIGAVALAPSDANVVWVGTGEGNPRNSVTWGNGVFLSRDGGKTWTQGGLAATNHIGKIAVHPREPLTAYVAALGRVWGDNPERGLFVTRDGGKTWTHTLQLDDKTGCVDVAIDPADPQTVYATAYRVRRDAYSGGNPAEQFGPRAGIYRSRDGGKTWTRLTRGLPARPLGRIGLAVWRKDPRAVFAVVQTDRTDTRRVAGQPPKHTAANVDVGGVFYSNDRGESWQKVNDLCPRPFYFGQVRVDPTDHRRLWVLGIALFVSSDSGQNFSAEGARGVHVDHHDLWIDPADPQHLILGNDGGLYYSRNRGKSWTAIKNLPISQFYHVAVDRRMPYHVYGGLQDNGTWSGPSRTSSAAGILNGDWSRVLHMDGFACAVSPDDPDTVYAEGQYGRLHRVSLSGKKAVQIQPRTPKNSPPFRFNWNAPLVLSPHDGRTLYFGGSLVFKSTDRGGTWSRISPDLTLGRSTSASYSHTLTALAESPRQRGVLYAGSDDGTLHVSRNTGGSWTDLTARLPGPAARTIACLEPSPHAAGTVLACIDRHWQDDYRPHLYRSDDYGRTWRSVAGNLPAEGPVRVVRFDPRNPAVLYAGTEFGLFVSLDEGTSWQPFGQGFPPCPVYDLVVHPRDRELIVGTHGRGIWIVDVAPLQDLTPAVLAAPAHLFEVRAATRRPATDPPPVPAYSFAGQNPPTGAVVHYRLGRAAGPVRLEVLAESGEVMVRLPAAATAGVQRVVWDLRRRDATGQNVLVPPGEYTIRLQAAGATLVRKFRVVGAG